MGVTKIVWNIKAFREIRTSAWAQGHVDRAAERIAAAAGDGCEALPAQAPRNRARRVVATVTPEAAIRNERENTLIRSIDAGR